MSKDQDIKTDGQLLFDKMQAALESVTQSGILGFAAMGLVVRLIRERLLSKHINAPRDAAILMIGVDWVEKEMRGKAKDSITEVVAMAAMHYMITVEPTLSNDQKKVVETLMRPL